MGARGGGSDETDPAGRASHVVAKAVDGEGPAVELLVRFEATAVAVALESEELVRHHLRAEVLVAQEDRRGWLRGRDASGLTTRDDQHHPEEPPHVALATRGGANRFDRSDRADLARAAA